MMDLVIKKKLHENMVTIATLARLTIIVTIGLATTTTLAITIVWPIIVVVTRQTTIIVIGSTTLITTTLNLYKE